MRIARLAEPPHYIREGRSRRLGWAPGTWGVIPDGHGKNFMSRAESGALRVKRRLVEAARKVGVIRNRTAGWTSYSPSLSYYPEPELAEMDDLDLQDAAGFSAMPAIESTATTPGRLTAKRVDPGSSG
jgi:hypothetical protein